MLPRARLIVRKVVCLPVCASIVFLRGRARDRPAADNRRCYDMFNGEDGSSRISSSTIDMYNILNGALPLSSFLLVSPDHGRAALTRSFEPAANVRLRASTALRAMLYAAVTNRKREDCFLPRCLGVWEEHALMYMLLANSITGPSHDDPKASPLFVANAGWCRCGVWLRFGHCCCCGVFCHQPAALTAIYTSLCLSTSDCRFSSFVLWFDRAAGVIVSLNASKASEHPPARQGGKRLAPNLFSKEKRENFVNLHVTWANFLS